MGERLVRSVRFMAFAGRIRSRSRGTRLTGGTMPHVASPRPPRDDAKPNPIRLAKVQYLEGMRGIAAVQVVLLHFVTAFLPDTAEHAAPPLHILWDGHTAVYVFF